MIVWATASFREERCVLQHELQVQTYNECYSFHPSPPSRAVRATTHFCTINITFAVHHLHAYKFKRGFPRFSSRVEGRGVLRMYRTHSASDRRILWDTVCPTPSALSWLHYGSLARGSLCRCRLLQSYPGGCYPLEWLVRRRKVPSARKTPRDPSPPLLCSPSVLEVLW